MDRVLNRWVGQVRVGTWLRRHWGWRAGGWVTAMGESDAGTTSKRPAGYSAAEAYLPEDAQAGVGQGDTMGDAEAGVGVGGEELGCAKTRWRQTWKPLRATGQRKLTSESEKVERLQVRKSLSRAMRIFGEHNQSNQKPLRRKALRTTDGRDKRGGAPSYSAPMHQDHNLRRVPRGQR